MWPTFSHHPVFIVNHLSDGEGDLGHCLDLCDGVLSVLTEKKQEICTAHVIIFSDKPDALLHRARDTLSTSRFCSVIDVFSYKQDSRGDDPALVEVLQQATEVYIASTFIYGGSQFLPLQYLDKTVIPVHILEHGGATCCENKNRPPSLYCMGLSSQQCGVFVRETKYNPERSLLSISDAGILRQIGALGLQTEAEAATYLQKHIIVSVYLGKTQQDRLLHLMWGIANSDAVKDKNIIFFINQSAYSEEIIAAQQEYCSLEVEWLFKDSEPCSEVQSKITAIVGHFLDQQDYTCLHQISEIQICSGDKTFEQAVETSKYPPVYVAPRWKQYKFLPDLRARAGKYYQAILDFANGDSTEPPPLGCDIQIMSQRQQIQICAWLEKNKQSKNILLVYNDDSREWRIYGRKPDNSFIENGEIRSGSDLYAILSKKNTSQAEWNKIAILETATLYLGHTPPLCQAAIDEWQGLRTQILADSTYIKLFDIVILNTELYLLFHPDVFNSPSDYDAFLKANRERLTRYLLCEADLAGLTLLLPKKGDRIIDYQLPDQQKNDGQDNHYPGLSKFFCDSSTAEKPAALQHTSVQKPSWSEFVEFCEQYIERHVLIEDIVDRISNLMTERIYSELVTFLQKYLAAEANKQLIFRALGNGVSAFKLSSGTHRIDDEDYVLPRSVVILNTLECGFIVAIECGAKARDYYPKSDKRTKVSVSIKSGFYKQGKKDRTVVDFAQRIGCPIHILKLKQLKRDMSIEESVLSHEFAPEFVVHTYYIDNGLKLITYQLQANYTLDDILKSPLDRQIMMLQCPKGIIIAMLQIAQAIEHMHNKNFAHLDIKPANIVVFLLNDNEFRCKIIDLGAATKKEFVQGQFGTNAYIPPEVCGFTQYRSLPVDIYALGVLFSNMANTLGYCTAQLKINELLPSMLCAEPEKRITIGGVIGILKEAAIDPRRFHEQKLTN